MKRRSQSESDIAGFMVKIQEQLAVLDRKLDTFMTKSLTELAQAMSVSKPSSAQLVQTPHPGSPRPADNRQGRPMYRATCADCKQECEIPFKPSGDRPVYCKECYSKRKAGHTAKVTTEQKPQAGPVAVAPSKSEPSHDPQRAAKGKKQPSTAKKVPVKKKTAAKKKSR